MVLTSGKVRCAPWLVPALSGRGRKSRRLWSNRKAGFGDDAAQTMVSLSGLSATAATGVQSRVWPLQRRGLAWRARLLEFVAVPEQRAVVTGMALRRGSRYLMPLCRWTLL